jgi:hypothetical protein
MTQEEVEMTRRGVMGGILLWLLIGTGCATTNLESDLDKTFTEKPFRKVLVMAPMKEFTMRTQLEQAFVERMNRGSTKAVGSGNILLPDRTYKEAELKDILAKYAIDGVLMITLTGQYSQKIQIPEYTSCTSALVSANAAMLDSSSCDLGSYISRPTVGFKFRLYDVATDRTVWTATSETQGTTLSGFETAATSLAETTVKKLTEEDLIE